MRWILKRYTITIPADTLADAWKVRWRARAVSSTASSAWSDWRSFTVSLPKPTATGLIITPSKVVDGVTVSTTLTPTLKATVTHPAGQVLRAEAEIEHDPAAPAGQGSGQIWTGSVDNVASGTQASLTVPAATLTDGWKVRWRTRAVTEQASSAWSDWQQVTVDVTQPGEEPLAQTTGPVIRTDESFTAAAWLRWSDKDGDYSVIEQKGTHQAPFRIGNTPDHGLVFTLTSADSADATVEGVLSGVEPPVGEWFHLAGVYDTTAKTAALYLNGELLATSPVGAPGWNAGSAMTLGTKVEGGIDDVHVYQRPLDATAVGALSGITTPQPTTPAAKNTAPSAESTTPERERATGADNESSVAASNLPAFNYDRVNSLGDCTKLRENFDQRYSTPGWVDLRPYSACYSKFIAYGDWTYHATEPGKYPPKPDDGYKVESTVVMHTYLGNNDGTDVVGGGDRKFNEIAVWTQLDKIQGYDDGEPTDDFDDVKKLQLDVQPTGSDGADCVVTSGKPRRVSLREWKENGIQKWVVTSRVARDDVHNCTIRPLLFEFGGISWFNEQRPLWGKIEFENVLGNIRLPFGIQAIGLPTGSRSEFPPVARCDYKTFSKNIQARMHTGACIFTDANRIFTMRRSDTQIKQVVDHVDKALKQPSETVPKLPPLDAQGQPQSKVMPGDIDAPLKITVGGDEYTNPAWMWLVRGTDPPNTPKKNTLTYKNRLAIGPACRVQKASLRSAGKWPANVIVNGKSVPALQCDEYPFASTKNGASAAKGHFSIMYVDREDNRTHGEYLAAFYSRYRVGDDNRFWVRIVN
ncbi:LamG-like jellyroll fold domain-containing protein [Planomonospora corallina]|uniref:LamG-like jellyroll fold domain-containing protein n=1 Tax=Planomonospora corallina TaxID=1806052 RepID=A0ABV8ILN6_9ACTN